MGKWSAVILTLAMWAGAVPVWGQGASLLLYNSLMETAPTAQSTARASSQPEQPTTSAPNAYSRPSRPESVGEPKRDYSSPVERPSRTELPAESGAGHQNLSPNHPSPAERRSKTELPAEFSIETKPVRNVYDQPEWSDYTGLSSAAARGAKYTPPRDIRSTRDPVWDQEAGQAASRWLSFRRPDYKLYEYQRPDVERPLYPDRWVIKPLIEKPLLEKPWEDKPYLPTLSWGKPAEVRPSEPRPSWDRPNVVRPNTVMPPAVKPSFDRPDWNRPELVAPTDTRPEYRKPQDVRPDYHRPPL